MQELFQLFHQEPQCLPTEWRQQADGPGAQATARVVADYIAGMTDGFFRRTYEQMLGRPATLPIA